MIKFVMGMFTVVALVATGVISGVEIQDAGNRVAQFFAEDAVSVVNNAANSVADATAPSTGDRVKDALGLK